MRAVLYAFAASLALTGAVRADVTLPHIFGDEMVFQRNTPLYVWGTASPGEKVTVTLSSATGKAVAGADGRWETTLAALPAGGPYILTVIGANTVTRKDVLVGDLWLCAGQSNMQFSLQRAATGPQAIAASADPKLRLFKVGLAQPESPADDVKGSWTQASPQTTGGFSAVGYFFGRAIRKAEGDVPIGLIASNWGGTTGEAWTREAVLDANPDLKRLYVDSFPALKADHDKQMADYETALAKAKAAGKKEPQKPYGLWRYSRLYNGMIAPITHFPLRGVLWYQGESNAKDPDGYRILLPAMIADWRAQWQEPTLPFLLVQLAPFGTKAGDDIGWARLREVQAQIARTTPNVGLAVIPDIGTQHDIHPTDKEPVGDRLALIARKMVYGEKALVASGPTFKSLQIDGAKAIVTFDNVGVGLAIKGGMSSGNAVPADKLVGFTIAGADGNFVPAEAKIVGKDTVEVSSPQVTAPVAVRYGFVNFPIVNLWNTDGLPACPFRTDPAPVSEETHGSG